MDLHNWTMEKKLSWNIVMLRTFFLMQIRDGDMRTYCIVKQFISAWHTHQIKSLTYPYTQAR